MSRTQCEVGLLSDVGMRRSQNQDNGFADVSAGLFIVADGMGGHQGGETASRMAVEIISDELLHCLKEKPRKDETHLTFIKRCMQSSILRANEEIFETSLNNNSLRGMGTTTTALYLSGSTSVIGHVGDSRCYRIRKGLIWQLTRDHSLVQEKLRAGLINRAQVKTDRMKNVITRSVGFEREVFVDLYEIPVEPGDVFVLCSDGLSGPVDDLSMRELVERTLLNGKPPEEAVKALIAEANSRGGDDNITAIAVKVVSVKD